MFGPKETMEVLSSIMYEWQYYPKSFCLQKILGWTEKEASVFLKGYNKEKKKYLKQQTIKCDDLSDLKQSCCNTQKCCD